MSCFRKSIFSLSLLSLVVASPAHATDGENKERPGATNSTGQKPATDPSIAEAQRQLEDIIQIHKSLQSQHQREIEEIQKIMEKARAQQKLLKAMSVGPDGHASGPSVTGMDIEQMVRSKRIRSEEEPEDKKSGRKFPPK